MSVQGNKQAKPQSDTREEPQAGPQTAPTEPNGSSPSTGLVWVRIAPLAGDAHGGHCHLDRGGGTWRTLPHLAATHIRQLVRRRALSGGGAQPSGQLVPAASQNDQAPPRYRAHLFGAVGGIAPDSGDLLARDSRPDQQPYQVHRRRSKRPRGGRRSTSRVSSSKTGWVLCTRRSAASSVIYRARCRIWQRVSSPLPQR